MDRYPEVKVSERECLREDPTTSRHDSASSVNKAANSQKHNEQTPQRTDSTTSSTKSTVNESESKQIEAKYAQYTDAPPPYSEQQYEGKSEQERADMRMTDYAKEISRMMGRQLVRGLKTGKSETAEEK